MTSTVNNNYMSDRDIVTNGVAVGVLYTVFSGPVNGVIAGGSVSGSLWVVRETLKHLDGHDSKMSGFLSTFGIKPKQGMTMDYSNRR